MKLDTLQACRGINEPSFERDRHFRFVNRSAFRQYIHVRISNETTLNDSGQSESRAETPVSNFVNSPSVIWESKITRAKYLGATRFQKFRRINYLIPLFTKRMAITSTRSKGQGMCRLNLTTERKGRHLDREIFRNLEFLSFKSERWII